METDGDDVVDEVGVAHAGDAALGADVGGDPLERHHGDGAGVFGDPRLLGGHHVHDHAALQHLGESALDAVGAERGGGGGAGFGGRHGRNPTTPRMPRMPPLSHPGGGGMIERVKILSIQSAVAYGHVGNSAAVFPLQRIGVEVLPVYTVNFSNHTGYGAWRGPLIAPDDVRDVLTGIEERGVFPQIDVVLSGYQGGEGIGEVIIDAVARVKAANPSAVYACDPVMGNAKSGCFVAPAIPVLLRERVVPVADLITPNQFELGYLTGTEPDTIESTLDSADAARAMGPRTVLVTSVERPDREPGTIEMLVVDDRGRLDRADAPAADEGERIGRRHGRAVHRALPRDRVDASAALARTVSSVFDLLRTTHESGERELQLVESQEFYAHPRMQFEVRQLR